LILKDRSCAGLFSLLVEFKGRFHEKRPFFIKIKALLLAKRKTPFTKYQLLFATMIRPLTATFALKTE